MFGDVAHFLIEIVFTLFGAILILRTWLQAVRLPPANPISRGIFQATNWLVLPLRKIIPAFGGIDLASLVGAWLTAIVYLALMVAVVTGNPSTVFPLGLVMALLIVCKWILNLVVWVTLLMAILSWINPRAEIMPLLYQLTEPFLDPLRRILPRMGGFDLSPLVLYLIAQVLLIVVARIGITLFGF